eukprot:817129-Pelagomonas_calceolata.AAC.1
MSVPCRLRAHTLEVEAAAWNNQNALLCNHRSCDEIHDEGHALLVCRDERVTRVTREKGLSQDV